MCFRNGWKGSDLYVGLLDREFEPVETPPVKLEIHHPASSYGREDSRMFMHNGKPHVMFIGVEGGSKIRCTNVLVARLGPDFKVESVVHPHLEGRHLWEKNWGTYSYKNDIYAVYSISPHRVVRIDDGKAIFQYEETFPIEWAGGEWRGGASPYLVGEEYWNWCHDRISVNGMLHYRSLLYCFSAKPPFRPTRYVPEPVLHSDPSTRPADQYASCLFTVGSVLVDGTWYLSSGVHDRWMQLDKLSHAELESRLRKI